MALGVAHEDKWIVEEDREGEKGRGRGRGRLENMRLEKVRVEGEEHRCFREFILHGRATFSYIPNAGRLTITLGVALVKRQFLLLLCSIRRRRERSSLLKSKTNGRIHYLCLLPYHSIR